MELQQQELISVQCESCHGYGAEHMGGQGPIPMAEPEIKICIKCHTKDRSPTFEKDLKIYMQEIQH